MLCAEREDEGPTRALSTGDRSKSLLSEDCCPLLVDEDRALQLTKVGRASRRDLYLFDHQFAFVVKLVVLRNDRVVVTREVKIEVDRVGSFIDNVARR